MRFAWLEALLPPGALKIRHEFLWVLFFVLFPVAFFAGLKLESHDESPAMMAGFKDRAASIRIAEEFAASKGYPVTGWQSYAVAKTDDGLLAYYGSPKDAALAAASALAPAQSVQVLFRSPNENHEFRAYLSLTGKVLGYQFGRSSSGKNESVTIGPDSVTTTTSTHSDKEQPASMTNAIMLTDKDAENIARQALESNDALNGLVKLGKPRVGSNEDDAARRDVIWDESPAGRPELTLRVTVGVRDGEVVAEHIKAEVDKKHGAKANVLRGTLIGFYSTFLVFGAIYAMVRYAKRTLQKEVSHVRTVVVAALFVVSYSEMVYSIAVDLLATDVSTATFAKIRLIAAGVCLLTFCIMGLLVGIAYGSGEGDAREAYPGKLTSLDALLAGRIFSREVGASLLCGAAAAGWFLFAQHALSHFLSRNAAATRSDVLAITFARLPWLTQLLGRQYDSLLVAASGLLLPAAFLTRQRMSKKKRFGWLIVFAVLSVLNDAAKYPTAATSLLAIVVLVCALLLPFFAFDLLAAVVSLSALAFMEQMVRLSAVFPSWNDFAVSLECVAGLSLVVAAYLALRGNPVREEDVRPLYAKNLAQRMSLQAEVLAAREAQLRLLPQSAPELPGVQFAACCLPARGVGGDFYDFFRLDANRVAIFVAQGGDQGLASALCIALAKGVLMHSSLQPNSPTQTLLNLETSFGELFEGGSAGTITFAYGVIDTRKNSLAYARLGDSPRFVVYRDGMGVVNSTQLERVVRLTPNSATIYEGSFHANPGDFMVFVTRGVSTLRTKRFGRREHQWVEEVMPQLSRGVEPMQSSLLSVLQKHQSKASDDLTAVILRVVQVQAMAQEVVA